MSFPFLISVVLIPQIGNFQAVSHIRAVKNEHNGLTLLQSDLIWAIRKLAGGNFDATRRFLVQRIEEPSKAAARQELQWRFCEADIQGSPDGIQLRFKKSWSQEFKDQFLVFVGQRGSNSHVPDNGASLTWRDVFWRVMATPTMRAKQLLALRGLVARRVSLGVC